MMKIFAAGLALLGAWWLSATTFDAYDFPLNAHTGATMVIAWALFAIAGGLAVAAFKDGDI